MQQPATRRHLPQRNFFLGALILILAALACGRQLPYTQEFLASSGQCSKSVPGTSRSGTATITMSIQQGPNITLCTFRATNGTLLKHADLSIHGDVVGYAADQLYVDQRGGDGGTSQALCAVAISGGKTLWCQTQVLIDAIPNANIYRTNATLFISQRVQSSPQNTIMVYALNARNGNLLWQSTQNIDLSNYTQPLHMVVTRGVVIIDHALLCSAKQICDNVSQLTALQASSGKVLWKVASGNIGGMMADAEQIYFTNSVAVTALNPADGTIKWQIPFANTLASSNPVIAVANGIIFAPQCSSNTTCNLDALSAHDGTTLWTVPIRTELTTITTQGPRLFLFYQKQFKSDGMTPIDVLEARNLSDGSLVWQEAYMTSEKANGAYYPNEITFSVPVTAGNETGNTTGIYLNYKNNFADNALTLLNGSDGTRVWTDTDCSPKSYMTVGITSQCYWKTAYSPKILILA